MGCRRFVHRGDRNFRRQFRPGRVALAAGQLVSISQNTAVFSILGTIYGGNGTTNFALPNLTSSTMIGTGQGSGLSQQIEGVPTGSSTVILTSASKPPDIGGSSQPFGNISRRCRSTTSFTSSAFIRLRGWRRSLNDMIGEIVPFAGNFAPGGWAFCDGSLLSIAQNSVPV